VSFKIDFVLDQSILGRGENRDIAFGTLREITSLLDQGATVAKTVTHVKENVEALLDGFVTSLAEKYKIPKPIVNVTEVENDQR
jgi:hypothetical protein